MFVMSIYQYFAAKWKQTQKKATVAARDSKSDPSQIVTARIFKLVSTSVVCDDGLLEVANRTEPLSFP